MLDIKQKGRNDVRIAVVGSRNISLSFERFYELLGDLLPDNATAVISGGARGVDRLAAQFAKLRNLPVVEHLPDYNLFGRTAPLVRNRTIIDDSDFVVAIWDGKSRGTLNSIDYTLECNKPLVVYYIEHDEVRFFRPCEEED